MSDPSSIPILDVRPEGPFAAGHAPGAASIPLEELRSRTHELPPKGSAIRLFDSDPRRLQQALDVLGGRGYRVEEAALTPDDLTQTGPSSAWLWRPSPFLVEALDCMAKNGDWLYSPSSENGACPLFPAPHAEKVDGDRSKGDRHRFLNSENGASPRSAEGAAVPRRALDLACGAGREAVWLATRGYQVDALDVLSDALQRAEDLARRCGVHIRTMQRDLSRLSSMPWNPYDLVIVFRFLNRRLLPMIGGSVAPGGFLIYEAFHWRDPGQGPALGHGPSPQQGPEPGRVLRPNARPIGPEHVVQDGELPAAFEGFEPIIARDGVERDGRRFSQLLARRREA
jgi:tellurite methyltransferase